MVEKDKVSSNNCIQICYKRSIKSANKELHHFGLI